MAEQRAENIIAPAAADKLIAAHDGDVALLYLHRLRAGRLDEEQAARDLCRTLQEIRAAEEKLRRMGLLEEDLPARTAEAAPAPAPAPAPAEELPQYSAGTITRASLGNEALEVLYAEAKPVMGHELNSNDMRVIFGIYDHLGLPPEVILELLHFCREKAVGKNGEQLRVSAGMLEKEAYIWARQEILTLEQAEEYIRFRRERRSEIGRLREMLGLQTLSATQEKDLNAWLDQGFGQDAISIAADRTITNTGALKWSYLRKILLSWHEKGLHSPGEIQEKDPPRAQSRAVPAPRREDKPVDPASLRKILDKI